MLAWLLENVETIQVIQKKDNLDAILSKQVAMKKILNLNHL
jgi:hypothetical protein